MFEYRNFIEQERDRREGELAKLNESLVFRLLAKVPGTEEWKQK